MVQIVEHHGVASKDFLMEEEAVSSSSARLRLSSARRSSIGAAFTEGERTDTDASC